MDAPTRDEVVDDHRDYGCVGDDVHRRCGKNPEQCKGNDLPFMPKQNVDDVVDAQSRALWQCLLVRVHFDLADLTNVRISPDADLL